MQIHELLEAVVAVDDAAIQVIQIGGRKAAAIQWHQGAQLGRNDRDDVEDHPLGLIARLAECLDYLQALGIFQALLQGRFDLHLLAQLDRQLIDVDALEKFLDRFGAHHAFEAGGAILLVELAEHSRP